MMASTLTSMMALMMTPTIITSRDDLNTGLDVDLDNELENCLDNVLNDNHNNDLHNYL